MAINSSIVGTKALRVRRFLVTGVMMMSLGACLSGRSGSSSDGVGIQGNTQASSTTPLQVQTGRKMGPPASAAIKAAKIAPKAEVATATPTSPLQPVAVKTVIGPATTKPKMEVFFVAVPLLNVRSEPSALAPVVGQLARGSKLPVAVSGKWAMLAEGKYVLASYLSREKAAGSAQKGSKLKTLAKAK